MTLQYLGTARLNATPLARHIDTPEQQAPVYTNLDALIADMMADAKAIRKRQEKTNATKQTARGPLPESAVFDFIAQNPGCDVYDVARHFKRAHRSVSSLLSRMETRGILKVSFERSGNNRPRRLFQAVNPQRVSRDQKSQTQTVYDCIKANPDLTKPELAEKAGLTVKQIEGALTNMGRYPERFPLRRVYEGNIRTAPVRLSVPGVGQ